MSTGKKVRVGIVGLGFGAEFVPLYQKHPDAECYAICQRDEAKLATQTQTTLALNPSGGAVAVNGGLPVRCRLPAQPGGRCGGRFLRGGKRVCDHVCRD